MKHGVIQIELLSDLCTTDGGAYNSQVDTEICSETYGFPYIPGKRLRGCLRECALELKDWGEQIDPDYIFGKAGDADDCSKIEIDNGFPEKYLDMRNFVSDNAKHPIVNRQNVLNSFSYLRTQTAIDYDTGIADDRSLRTMRVADRKLIFEAEYTIRGRDENEDSKLKDQLESCCAVLRHIGVSRTRGLGEITAKVIEQVSSVLPTVLAPDPLVQNANELTYEIDLVEPVICKSVNGGEAHSQDYLEGAKLLGLIAQDFRESFPDFMDKGNLRVSNAYICEDGKRLEEAPGYLYTLKSNKKQFVNTLYYTPEKLQDEFKGEQLNQLKHCYVGADGTKLIKADVMTQVRYHHRRPEDKSIGKATKSDGNANLYLMESIVEGQKFAGKITGSPEQIQEVYRIFNANRTIRIGYSRTSEYGKALLRITSTAKREPDLTPVKECVVNLVSPTIVYGTEATVSCLTKDLRDEILTALGLINTGAESTQVETKDIKIDYYLKHTFVGGWNVTWKRRKPTLDAFDKGTAVRITFPSEVKIPTGTVWIGERNAEGYGEASVLPIDHSNQKGTGTVNEVGTKEDATMKKLPADSEFAKALCEQFFDSYVRNKAVEMADKEKLGTDYRATVSNLLLMSKEINTIEEIRAAVEDRYKKASESKKKKKAIADRILKKAETEAGKLVPSFEKEYQTESFHPDEETYKMLLLKGYLMQLKYRIRPLKEG